MPDAHRPDAARTAIRLLVVIGSFNRGGCERHLLRVLPVLDPDCIEVEVFVLDKRGPLANVIESCGVPVHAPWIKGGGSRNPLFRGARIAVVSFQLWMYLIKRRPQITHYFLPASYLIGVPVAIMAGVKRRVLSRRSLDHYQRARPWLAAIERAFHRTTTAFIGNSRTVVQQLVEKERVPAERATVIYNGVPIPELVTEQREEIRAIHALGSNTLVMVIVANLIPYKGHVDLLRACARARDKLPVDWVLLIIGRDDGIGDELVHLVKELGLSNQVRFLGERDDVESVLAVCDIGLLVSYQEGFSNAILECMAAGLPMVVTDVGGNAEAVADGETGRVVPLGDEAGLADALAELAGDADLRRAMGCAGRQRVLNLFGLDRCVEDYTRFYQAVAADHFVGDFADVEFRDHEFLD